MDPRFKAQLLEQLRYAHGLAVAGLDARAEGDDDFFRYGGIEVALSEAMEWVETGEAPRSVLVVEATLDLSKIAWGFPAVGAPAGVSLLAKHVDIDGRELPIALFAEEARALGIRLLELADEADAANAAGADGNR